MGCSHSEGYDYEIPSTGKIIVGILLSRLRKRKKKKSETHMVTVSRFLKTLYVLVDTIAFLDLPLGPNRKVNYVALITPNQLVLSDHRDPFTPFAAPEREYFTGRYDPPCVYDGVY